MVLEGVFSNKDAVFWQGIGTLSHRKTMFIAVQQHKYMGERSTLAHPSLPRSHHFLYLADVSANWGCS